jgi:hypothetical protein
VASLRRCCYTVVKSSVLPWQGCLSVCVLSSLFEFCRRFGPGRSLDRRANLSLRALAQMGWREMEHKGKTRLVLSRTRGVCLQ